MFFAYLRHLEVYVLVSSIDEIQALMDPRNPLTSYVYLVFIAICIRFFLIIIPLWKAYSKFAKKGILSRMLKLRKAASLQGIYLFLVSEIIWLMLPLFVAGIWRFFLGTPAELLWSYSQLLLALFFGLMWVVVDVLRTLETNKQLQILEKWYAKPYLIKGSLETVLSSRGALERLSEIAIEEPQEPDIEYGEINQDPLLIRDNDGKFEAIDTDALSQKAEDIIENAGVFLKKAAHTAKEKYVSVTKGIKAGAESAKGYVDQTLQKKVNEVTKDNRSTIVPIILNLVMSIYPLIIVYYLLPWLG